MRFKALILWASLFSLLPTVPSFAATQFKTFRDAMERMRDYRFQFGEISIQSETPLNFSLIKSDTKNNDKKYKVENAQHAFIYGTYRAFCHTKAPEITISATVGYSDLPGKVRPDPAFEIRAKITREQAMKALSQAIPGTTGCDDIIGGDDFWKEPFRVSIVRKSDQDRLLQALIVKGTEKSTANSVDKDINYTKDESYMDRVCVYAASIYLDQFNLDLDGSTRSVDVRSENKAKMIIQDASFIYKGELMKVSATCSFMRDGMIVDFKLQLGSLDFSGDVGNKIQYYHITNAARQSLGLSPLPKPAYVQ